MSGDGAANSRRAGFRASRTAPPARCATLLLFVPMLAFLLLAPATAAAQGYPVTGRVTGAAAGAVPAPLAGVSVTVKGTSTAVVTSPAGIFTITARSASDTLVFALLGYKTQQVPVAGRSRVEVVLEEEVFLLDALVVVGYGVQTKASMTGSVGVISSAQLARTPAVMTAEAMVGKIQGITTRITPAGDAMGDARPGSQTYLQIRNLGEPLFIIDGVPHSSGQFNNINAADIESISILKDASASVYGFRAANGVVLVTTKQGKSDQRPQINIDAYYGVQNITDYPFNPPANAYEFQRAWVESQQNRGQPRSLTAEQLEMWRLGTDPAYRSFNQYDYVINNPNAAQYSANASVSGGGNSSSYYLSVGHVSQDYVMKGHNFNRTNLQANLRSELFSGFAVGAQLSGRIEERDNVAINGRDDVVWNALLGINSSWPMDNPYANDNRDYVNGSVRYLTRLASTYTKEVSGWQLDTWRNVSANVFAEYRLPFGTQLKGTYAYTYKLNGFELQRYSYDAYCYDKATDAYNICAGFYSPLRTSNRSEVNETFAQLQLSHRQRLGQHNLSGVLAYELSGSENNGIGLQAVPPTNYSHLMQFNQVNSFSDSWGISRRASYIGRFNYDYGSKYLFEVLGRYDGSYLYAPGKRWGLFPGVSLGWRLTEEPFLRERLSFLDDLKLRASWGEAGREQGVGAWGYLSGATYGAGAGSVFDNVLVTGVRPRGLPVTNLTWVTSTSRNAGFDVSLLKRKLRGEFDVFERKLSGLPAQRYDVLLPSEVGYSLPNENLESEATRGMEGMLTYSTRAGAFDYTLNANATVARRRILERYKPRYGNSWQQYRNASENRWAAVSFGYEVIGQFKSMEEIENYDVNIDGQGNRTLLPGDLIYKDVNGDGIINAMDERPIGYGVEQNPILAYGFGGSVSYRGLSLDVAFAGGTMYSYNRNLEMKNPFQGDHNSPQWMLTDRWHRADPYDDNSEWIPGFNPPIRRGLTNHVSYTRTSDFWRTNVNYVRLKRLELAYTLPQSMLGSFGLQSARVYLSGANLLTFSNLSHIHLDPEVAQDSGLRYPTNRVVNLGFSTTLGARNQPGAAAND